MSWTLPYTSHLGYLPPELQPQFACTVGSVDVVAHIEHAAGLGFAGVLYPWAPDRPEAEVDAVRRALTSTGLGCSCVVSVPFDAVLAGLWCADTPEGRTALRHHVAAAASVAASLGATVLAVIITAAPGRNRAEQLDAAAANLAAMAAVAADHGLRLGIEPMAALPGVLVTTTVEAVTLIERAGHRSVGVIFDSAHVHSTEGDILAAYDRCAEHVVLVQLADDPGRIEPGAGTLPLVELATRVIAGGYCGLVDLETVWAEPGAAGERRGLDRLREFDERIRRASSVNSGIAQVSS